ncbi:MAG: response regulator, partial [Pseudomonadota bacterium]
SGASTTVLVCDDDPDITDLVEQQLRKAGFTVHVCHSAESALQDFDTANPDIVLLDATLGEVAGTHVAKALRERGASIPILLFSSIHPRLGRTMAIDSGCDDFLAKPASAATLIAKIRQLSAQTA